LVIHAVSGCDTTSSMFGHGKPSVFSVVTKNQLSLHLTRAVGSPSSSSETVFEAGKQLLGMIYGAKEDERLNSLRYRRYMQILARSTQKPRPERLPPTERAAYFHLMRVHLQVVQWNLLKTDCLIPTDWGWELHDNAYVPTMTDLKPAPAELLHVIVCQCQTTTNKPCGSKTCTCRRFGLHCVPACKNCYGEMCTNAAVLTTSDSTCDNDRDEDEQQTDQDKTTDVETDSDFGALGSPVCEEELWLDDDCGLSNLWLEEEVVENVRYLDD